MQPLTLSMVQSGLMWTEVLCKGGLDPYSQVRGPGMSGPDLRVEPGPDLKNILVSLFNGGLLPLMSHQSQGPDIASASNIDPHCSHSSPFQHWPNRTRMTTQAEEDGRHNRCGCLLSFYFIFLMQAGSQREGFALSTCFQYEQEGSTS